MTGVSVQSLRVASLIEGRPSPTDFKVTDEKVTLSLDPRSLGPDEIVCVPEFISVDPYLRSRMAFWPVGFVGVSGTVLRVVNTGNPSAIAKGSYITGVFPWKTAHLLNISELQKQVAKSAIQIISKSEASVMLGGGGLSSSAFLGILGLTGQTAYYGLLKVGALKPTDNVLISGAAGATGSVCGQIAKQRGCPIVVGTAGSDDKCGFCRDIGYDTCLNYKKWKKGDYASIQADLRRAFPNGIDVYFDNTGGDLTAAVWDLMNKNGRVVICGQIAYYNMFKNQSDVSTVHMPSVPDFLFQTIYKSVRVEGFVVWDCNDWTEFYQEMPVWLKQKKVRNQETIVNGFENIPRAFIGLFDGRNTGKMVVDCRDGSSSLSSDFGLRSRL